MTAIPRRLGLFLLHLALIVALWTTALGRISDRPTSVRLLTGIGTHVLNPVLTAGGNGIGPGAYDQLQQLAKAKPNDPLPLPGLNVTIYGRDIAGESFDQGTRTIYTKVAEAYYDGGASAALTLPPNLTGVIFNYGALSQFAKDHGSPVALPQVPSGLLDLLGHTGLSADTFTRAGHDATVRVATIAWIAALLLALLVFFFSRRWGRLFSVSNALSNAALPGLAVLAILWFVVGRDPTRFPALNGLADIVFGGFMPVYLGAFLAGLAGQAVAAVLHLTTRGAPSVPREPVPAPIRAYNAPPASSVRSNLPETPYSPYGQSQGYQQQQGYRAGSQSAYPGAGSQSTYPGAAASSDYPGAGYPSQSPYPGAAPRSPYPGTGASQESPYPGVGQQSPYPGAAPRSPYPGSAQRPYPRSPYDDPGPTDPEENTQPF